jgi:L-2-hydroxyglutarate oxidase LhgO
VETLDTVVVGAGVVGLAIARALSLDGVGVVVAERHGAPGTEGSSRNSEVIHAGIYYPPGSLKARLCVAGKRALYDYCAARGVAHRRLGKLIVGHGDAERGTLRHYVDNARRNGVDDLEWLDGAAIRELEPEVHADAAILSPSTGIVDSHGLVAALEADIVACGSVIVYDSPLLGAHRRGTHWDITLGGSSAGSYRCRRLVNAAGLGATELAHAVGTPPEHVPERHLCRGNYFSYAGRAPFRRLVYPVASSAGLGIHATLDLDGRVRFGPDVEWVDGIDYAVDESRRGAFVESIRRYFPDVDGARLQPDYAGIRTKLAGPGEPAQDFRVDGPERHGLPGLVNLFGIESPGLTASLALARHVTEMLN